MIYEIVLKVEKKVAGKFAKWLPEHIKQVLESPGFKLARVARPQSETESDHLKWVVQYDIASKEYFESYLNERAPQMRAQAEQEFGNALIYHSGNIPGVGHVSNDLEDLSTRRF